MNALAEDFWNTNATRTAPSKLRVWDSHWGFNVSEKKKRKNDQSTLWELAIKLVGMMMIPAAGIVLFLPGMTSPTNGIIAVQAAMLFAFLAVGYGLHRYADRGFRMKFQVDSARGELRLGTLNAKDRFCVRTVLKVADIESVFIVRSKEPGKPAQLRVRMKSGTSTVPLAEGSERSLVPILERIIVTLQPPRANKRRVRTMTTGQFIRASFG
ncbi:MAG: hypothetical protein HKP37_01730 [Boseongicola sp.]|nr:hypothetical protein [Boseongicola sp.]